MNISAFVDADEKQLYLDTVFSEDKLCRYGEQLIALLPGTDLKGAYQLADKIRMAVEELENRFEEKVRIPVTISAGGASFTCDDLMKITAGDQLIKYADTALYRAKEKGKNRVEVAENVMM